MQILPEDWWWPFFKRRRDEDGPDPAGRAPPVSEAPPADRPPPVDDPDVETPGAPTFQADLPLHPLAEDYPVSTTVIAQSKVTMLGHQRSGKTCFMIGMYNEFSTFSQKLPFTLFSQKEADDHDLRHAWEDMEDMENIKWPPGTGGDIKPYLFEMRVGLDPLINISWIDYRGNAIMPDATDEEKEQLREQLSGSECLFLCVESKTLQSGGRKDNNKIAHFGMWTKDLPAVPLVILVTKADEFELPGQGPDPGPATAAAGTPPQPIRP